MEPTRRDGHSGKGQKHSCKWERRAHGRLPAPAEDAGNPRGHPFQHPAYCRDACLLSAASLSPTCAWAQAWVSWILTVLPLWSWSSGAQSTSVFGAYISAVGLVVSSNRIKKVFLLPFKDCLPNGSTCVFLQVSNSHVAGSRWGLPGTCKQLWQGQVYMEKKVKQLTYGWVAKQTG